MCFITLLASFAERQIINMKCVGYIEKEENGIWFTIEGDSDVVRGGKIYMHFIYFIMELKLKLDGMKHLKKYGLLQLRKEYIMRLDLSKVRGWSLIF